MIYEIKLSDQVKLDLVRLAKSEPKVFAKANRFIEELKVHPKTGLGHHEPLKGRPEGRWSREIGNSLFSKITDTSAIDTMSMKEQVKSLYSIVHYVINNDSVNSYFQAFANVYLQNDTCMMWQYLNKAGFVAGAESEDDNDHEIQYDRNVKWIPVIMKNIAETPCMVAVGCRHLMGSESLIALLRRKGYTVEAVK